MSKNKHVYKTVKNKKYYLLIFKINTNHKPNEKLFTCNWQSTFICIHLADKVIQPGSIIINYSYIIDQFIH